MMIGPMVLALLGAAVSFADPSASSGCAACHKDIVGRKSQHGPVAVGMCAVCHVDEKPGLDGKHAFSLSRPQPELCLSCHEGMRETIAKAAVPHGALRTGGCTACHDPHGSSQRAFLKGKTMEETCSACHDAVTKGAVVHPPVKVSCALCHSAHGGPFPKLLKAASPGLCVGCHGKIGEKIAAKHVHGPVQAGCRSCHEPHFAPKAMLLKADHRQDLCLGCHEAVAQKVRGSKNPHQAVKQAGCVGCHDAHGSPEPVMLVKPMKALCVGCHKDKDAELNSRFLHGPVALNECQGCHEPHGSENGKLLNTFFPGEFYNEYKDNLYALCFNCHEKDIARAAKTTKLTDFRDGDRNLHFIHVNSKKGRSCKACHQVHGGSQEKHVSTQVPFGSWMLPISFKKTATGGGCTVGCHNPKSYDRVHQVGEP
jgi:predicted CXXCH cytochrome family protein